MDFLSFILAAIYVIIAGIFICGGIVTFLEKQTEKKHAKVSYSSKFYHDVSKLSDATFYHRMPGTNGQIVYTLTVNSKTQFDSTPLDSALTKYLTANYDYLSSLFHKLAENKKIWNGYHSKLGTLHSSVTPGDCNALHIRYDEYRRIENALVQEAILNIPISISLICYIKYTSPQGRNSYSKHNIYSETDIRNAMAKFDQQRQYQATEEYRRKTERAKVTPTLRYNVMQRDRQRCKICGRSAKDGVTLEVDHIIPISKGGQTIYSNLQTLCKDCNRGKSNKV